MNILEKKPILKVSSRVGTLGWGGFGWEKAFFICKKKTQNFLESGVPLGVPCVWKTGPPPFFGVLKSPSFGGAPPYAKEVFWKKRKF